MKKYSVEEIATIVLMKIRNRFDNPEKIYKEFKGNIDRKAKSFHQKKLTDNEVFINSMKISTSIFNDLNRITIQVISNRLSNEIINNSLITGIEISEYETYLNNFSKEMVKDFLQYKYNLAKIELSQAKKKRK